MEIKVREEKEVEKAEVCYIYDIKTRHYCLSVYGAERGLRHVHGRNYYIKVLK